MENVKINVILITTETVSNAIVHYVHWLQYVLHSNLIRRAYHHLPNTILISNNNKKSQKENACYNWGLTFFYISGSKYIRLQK